MRRFFDTPLGAVLIGLGAGAAGTAALTAVQMAEARLRGGGEQESPPSSWEEAPAPAQVGERVAEGVFQKQVDLGDAPALTNAVHWSYGTLWGALYGLAGRSFEPSPAVGGAALGTTVWGAGYTALPTMGIYKPAWKYPVPTLAVDLARHLVYGVAVAAAFAGLERALR